MRNIFTQKLFRWYNLNKRNLPWIGSNDPYRVWLSEVILQQTRVEQGLGYYQKFVKKYPDIQQLAKAPADEVMKMWEGLGYYSRARNMHSTAQHIVTELKGRFPDTYEELIKLKGIGQYTAHAILAYAYKKPFAVVDGNVLRILARYFGIREPVDSAACKLLIQQKANALLDQQQPEIFNQALMDFGSQVCTPRKPNCENCPLQKTCKAYSGEATALIPVKSKKIQRQVRYFNFIILHDGKQVLVEQRLDKDIWKNLYQFPTIETQQQSSLNSILKNADFKALGIQQPINIHVSDIFKQQLTHRQLICRFYIFEVSRVSSVQRAGAQAVRFNQLKQLAFPGVIRDFLKIYEYF